MRTPSQTPNEMHSTKANIDNHTSTHLPTYCISRRAGAVNLPENAAPPNRCARSIVTQNPCTLRHRLLESIFLCPSGRPHDARVRAHSVCPFSCKGFFAHFPRCAECAQPKAMRVCCVACSPAICYYGPWTTTAKAFRVSTFNELPFALIIHYIREQQHAA